MIEQETRTRIGVASRVLGFKPLFTDELKQEIYRSNMASRTQAGLKKRLSDSLHTAMRSGSLKGRDVENALSDYIVAGGTPEGFRRFFASQVIKGKYSRVHREVQESLQGSIDLNRAARLLHLMHPGY